MDEVEITIRVKIHGEYVETINTHAYVECKDDDIHDEVMSDAREEMKFRYGNHEAWDDGEVSWTVDY